MQRLKTAIVICGVLLPIAAAASPLDDPAFSQYVVNRLMLIENPNVRVAVDGPLRIKMTYPSGGTVATSLDLLHTNCVLTPADCEDLIAGYVDQWRNDDPKPAPRTTVDPVQFWGVVVPPPVSGAVSSGGLVIGPWVGDLNIRCRIGDYDLQARQLEPLQLAPTDAVALCRKHTIENQKPFASAISDLPLHSNDSLRTPFASSLLLSHDEWEKIAARFDDELIMAVPDTDSIVYGHGAGAADIAALVNEARIVATNNADDVTKAKPNWKSDIDKCCKVYRWTSAGWTVVTP